MAGHAMEIVMRSSSILPVPATKLRCRAWFATGLALTALGAACSSEPSLQLDSPLDRFASAGRASAGNGAVAGSSKPISAVGGAGSMAPAGGAGSSAAGSGRDGAGNRAVGSLGGGADAAGVGGASGAVPAADGGGGAVVAGTGGAGASASPSCLDGITDYENAGPFQFEAKSAGMVKLWVPAVPAGCKVPVIHLANGTGATCSNYQPALERLATHGFLTTCFEDPNTGAGTQGVMAFETALAMFPDLADNKLGSTGHSQGGQAAFTVLQLAEEKWGDTMVYAGLAMEPASGFGTQPAGGTWQEVYAKIKSPMFMFSGTADVLVSESWVQQAYDAMPTTNEVYWWSAIGATHIPTPVGPEEQISIPWFRWKLLGDKAACEYFKKMPDGSDWDKRMSENEAPCQ
jgi:hypothetical protein